MTSKTPYNTVEEPHQQNAQEAIMPTNKHRKMPADTSPARSPPTRKTTPTRQGSQKKKSRVPKMPIPQAASPTNFGWGTPPSDEGLDKPQTQADKPLFRETPNTRRIPTSLPPHPHQHNHPTNRTPPPHCTGPQGPPYPGREAHH